jgi:type II secretory pathway component PulJ
MNRRRGISLVELMLTLSACSVILTLSAALIHRAMHAQAKARVFFDGERSAWRLAESFRHDVHRANSAKVVDQPDSGDLLLRLELAGGQRVEYRHTAGRVERTWHVDGGIRAREAFVFPPETRLSTAKVSEKLLVLTADAPADTAAKADAPLANHTVPVSLRVQAVLGRKAAILKAEIQKAESQKAETNP